MVFLVETQSGAPVMLRYGIIESGLSGTVITPRCSNKNFIHTKFVFCMDVVIDDIADFAGKGVVDFIAEHTAFELRVLNDRRHRRWRPFVVTQLKLLALTS
jgi:hypothetical protein